MRRDQRLYAFSTAFTATGVVSLGGESISVADPSFSIAKPDSMSNEKDTNDPTADDPDEPSHGGVDDSSPAGNGEDAAHGDP